MKTEKIETSTRKRKKVCPQCGRNLWLRDFYKLANGQRWGACKECQRKQKSDWYNANRKKPDGVFYDAKQGRAMEHHGASKRIYWTGDMLSILRRYFANTKTEEVAEMLGVSHRTVVRKARELGLEKDPSFLRQVWDEHRLLAHVSNKKNGNSGQIKKGHTPWNKGLRIKEAV